MGILQAHTGGVGREEEGVSGEGGKRKREREREKRKCKEAKVK